MERRLAMLIRHLVGVAHYFDRIYMKNVEDGVGWEMTQLILLKQLTLMLEVMEIASIWFCAAFPMRPMMQTLPDECY